MSPAERCLCGRGKEFNPWELVAVRKRQIYVPEGGLADSHYSDIVGRSKERRRLPFPREVSSTQLQFPDKPQLFLLFRQNTPDKHKVGMEN